MGQLRMSSLQGHLYEWVGRGCGGGGALAVQVFFDTCVLAPRPRTCRPPLPSLVRFPRAPQDVVLPQRLVLVGSSSSRAACPRVPGYAHARAIVLSARKCRRGWQRVVCVWAAPFLSPRWHALMPLFLPPPPLALRRPRALHCACSKCCPTWRSEWLCAQVVKWLLWLSRWAERCTDAPPASRCIAIPAPRWGVSEGTAPPRRPCELSPGSVTSCASGGTG